MVASSTAKQQEEEESSKNIRLLSWSRELVSVPAESGGISVSAGVDVNFENNAPGYFASWFQIP